MEESANTCTDASESQTSDSDVSVYSLVSGKSDAGQSLLEPQASGSGETDCLPEPQTSDAAKSSELEGWAKEEIFELLQCLKSFGSKDIDSIAQAITSKTVEEITAAIDFYKKKVNINPSKIPDGKTKKSRSNIPRSLGPLGLWAKHLTESNSYDELQTECAEALRLIAEMEDIPSPACTGNIDFRKIYHSIANALEGKPIENDKLTAMILDKCITETALLSKTFMNSSSFKYIMDNLDMEKRDINCFSKPTDTHEQVAIRHLAAQSNYNPLNIEERHLKSTKQ